MSFNENFAQPDDVGELHASELHSSFSESLPAQAAEVLDPASGVSALQLWRRATRGAIQDGFVPTAESPAPFDYQGFKDQIPDTPIEAARARVKQEGLEKELKLPDQASIKEPVLDLMINEAREHKARAAAIARGPQGFAADALGFATSIGAGMVDPINMAAFSIPVFGEARMGAMMTSAGDSIIKRAGVRAFTGAAQGAVGTAALQPAEWWLHTLDGKDYTMTEALRSVAMGAGMGAAFHAGFGGIGDLVRRLQDKPLPGLEPGGLAPEAGGLAPDLPEPTPLPEVERSVRDDVFAQLSRAGVGEEQANAHAAVFAARYATRAQRLGLDENGAMDLYRNEGLTVLGPQGAIDVGGADHGMVDVRNPEAAGASYDQRKGKGLEGQLTLPGAEEIGQGELAQRKADERLKPTVEQKPMDIGLFGDESAQSDLLDRIKGRSYDQATGAPVFYSAVDRAIDASKQEKAPADQWLGMLRNATGVKPEEMEWLGLADWLKAQKGAVSKQAIADYVRANQIRVEETTKRQANGLNDSELLDRENGHAKFPSYQLPGGENYRELLLRLPQDTSKFDTLPMDTIAKRLGYGGWTSSLTAAQKAHVERIYEAQAMKPTEFDRRIQEIDEKIEDLRRQMPGNRDAVALPQIREGIGALDHERGVLMQRRSASETSQFRTLHWPEPNVLAHVRFNDRVIDGKRTLFLEEIQSDWHQKGRRHGYRGDTSALQKQLDDLNKQYDLETDNIYKKKLPLAETEAAIGRRHRIVDEMNDLHDKIREAKSTEKIPDAPFKTTWPELALKRMIRYAAENGYEKIAWTPGKVQADRYDLSKRIARVELSETSGGVGTPALHEPFDRGSLIAYDHTGREVIHKFITDPKELADWVGKEVAEKLLAQEAKGGRRAGMGARVRELSGLDLQVGGAGMSGFYDKMLPAAANKLTKKFGGKVEQGEVEVAPPNFHKYELRSADGGRIGLYRDHDEALAGLRANNGSRLITFKDIPGQQVHTLDVTPAMRQAAIEEGFPLFQAGGEGARGRITFGDHQVLVQLFKDANASTFMHEAGHLWLDELVRDANRADAPAQLKDDLAAALKWLGVEKVEDIGTAQHEQWARGFEQYLREGRTPSRGLAAVFEKFKRWLTAIYRAVGELGAPISDDVRGVMDRLLATDQEIAEAHGMRPGAVLADLPPTAREDVTRAAIADVINDRPVRAGELIEEAAKADPRIAESAAIGTAPKPARRAGQGPAAKDPENYSLLEFLSSIGGLRGDDALIGDVKSSIGRANTFVPGFGNLIRAPRELSTAARRGGAKGPLSLDAAREAAVHAGYLEDEGLHTGGESTSTVPDLLDAIDAELRGNKVYAHGRQPEMTKAERKRYNDDLRDYLDRGFHDALDEAGIPPGSVPDKTRTRVLDIMQHEGVTDPLVAYERAVMEETHNASEQGQAEPIGLSDPVPGWNALDESGAAPGTGRQPADVRAAGPGRAARQPGEADRGADWRRLADDRAGGDPAALEASREADRAPEPASVDPDKSPDAAEKASQEAEAFYQEIREHLSDEERSEIDELLAAVDREREATATIIKDGAACLAAAVM